MTGTRLAWDTLHPKRSLGRPDAQTLPRSVPSRSRLSFGRRGENEASIFERQKSPRLSVSPRAGPLTLSTCHHLSPYHHTLLQPLLAFGRILIVCIVLIPLLASLQKGRLLLHVACCRISGSSYHCQLSHSQAQAGTQTNALCRLPSSWTTSFPLVVVIARIASFCSPSSSSNNALRPSNQLQYHPRRPPSIPTFLPFRYHRVQLPSRSRCPL